MTVIRFEPRQDPNALTWDEVVDMGLDAVPPEHQDELMLADDEELVIGEAGPVILTPAPDGAVVRSRPYGPRPPAILLPFRAKR